LKLAHRTFDSNRFEMHFSHDWPVFRVLRSGLLTTLQDQGRIGYQHLGISPCGAMDSLALRLANRLVGNPENSTCVEITLPGLMLETLRDCRIAITGADLSPRLDGEPLALWRDYLLKGTQKLSFQKCLRGIRAYLAIEGAFQAQMILGSGSTDLRNSWGGFNGRSLHKGDLLFHQHKPGGPANSISRAIHPQVLWEYRNPFLLRVLPGPQADHFSDDGLEQFFSSEFQLHSSSSRMGYRLQGPSISALPAEIISDPVPLGAIQVLPNGELVLSMADHQTVGGYPKIAVLISADLPKAAQLSPRHRVRFKAVTLEEAHCAIQLLEQKMKRGIVEY
jgi:antagonist of KipI